jgi:hypothetical protein
MGWVHCHKRRGALLALAALMLQIVVSFGHVHVETLHLAGLQGAASHGAGARAQVSERVPAQNTGDDDDYCAICASIFLASTSFVSEPPKLPVPGGFVRVEHSFSVDCSVLQPRRLAFQSRAPPSA